MKFIPSVSGDLARRAGWLFLALLFVVTGLGVGIYSFWQSTHPDNTSTSQSQNAAATATTCNIANPVSAAAQTLPTTYKTETKTAQLIQSDLSVGSGAAAKAGDCLVVKYLGNLTNGTVFDEDFSKPQALNFVLGESQVIPGWDQGLVGMKVGGERRLIIPPSLGYGSQAAGSIPANSTLVFDVKLLSIK